MYVFGFAAAYLLGTYRAKEPDRGWNADQVSDLIFYAALGVILGGRIGYALFYNAAAYADNPFGIFKVWEGGMSFHGGLLGVILAMCLYGRKTNKTFWQVADFAAPLTPIGLFFGRLGNFINQELWGRTTDHPLGMVFPLAGPEPRHPSMLYEAALEGVLLFTLLWIYSSRPRKPGHTAGLFLLLYGVFRFAVEFVREPDRHIGFIAANWVTMGHLLCVPMILVGAWLLLRKSG